MGKAVTDTVVQPAGWPLHIGDLANTAPWLMSMERY